MYSKVFLISNTLVMYLNTITNTNNFFLNVFKILSNTLKKVFKYLKYKYFMYLTPSHPILMCENLEEWVTTLQSEFWTSCNLLNSKSVSNKKSELQ